LPNANLAPWRFGFVPPPACGEIYDGNSVMHSIGTHPSYTQVAVRYAMAMPCACGFLFPLPQSVQAHNDLQRKGGSHTCWRKREKAEVLIFWLLILGD